MKCCFIILSLFLLFSCTVFAQSGEGVEMEILHEQQLEALSESTESETEDDYDQQLLMAYKDYPLNINDHSGALAEFPLLSVIQINNLISYRKLLGDLVDIHELQAVPGFTLESIKKILPYITVSADRLKAVSFKKRWSGGKHQLILRPAFIPEISKGFVSAAGGSQYFTGGRPRLYFRYTYRYQDLLQYGIVGDKDAGERFGWGREQFGFDFNSFHFLARKLGIIKILVVGDFSVNMGQGLIHWQSQAFKKSSGVINIKRQSETLRPYHSAGEYNFHRGAGLTIQSGSWEVTTFASMRNISANISWDDDYGRIITSIQTSGLHRTPGELEDRNNTKTFTLGSNLKFKKESWSAGIHAVSTSYSLPVVKRQEPYNLFSMKGRRWFNLGAEYNYTFRNFHFFGELAVDKSWNTAFLNGLMGSLTSSIDIAILHRQIGRRYQSVYGNAFTESTMPSNERGLYTGISFMPDHRWKLDAYADLFSFPWLRYRVDAPVTGRQYLTQLTWKPHKQVEVYTRFRFKAKPLNTSMEFLPVRFPEDRILKNWRTHISFGIGENILLRNRLEACWFYAPLNERPETGFLVYTDMVYKPQNKWYSGSARLQLFETSGYDTRLYVYENDVLYSGGSPACFGKGIRAYINLRGKFRLRVLKNSMLNLEFRASSTVYHKNTSIGSGLNEIIGKHRSEFKLQLLLIPGNKNLSK